MNSAALKSATSASLPPLINPTLAARRTELAASFASARPFRHVVIDDFLLPSFAEEMLATFPSVEDASSLVNEFGSPNQKSQISDVRKIGPAYRQIDDFLQTSSFLQTMEAITGIAALEYDPWYFGAGTHENFHSAGLDPHYDFNIHPKTGHHRRLNAIVYLNKDWDPDWAGDICLHTNPWDLGADQKTRISPKFNRCVVFETTEYSWHSVTPVSLPETLRDKSRKSFTIYLYTATRPAAETAPEHGTVYVQPGLPEYIKVGRTLSEDDMATIDANLFRRQEYLRALYKREYKFSEVIENLKVQIQEWKRRSHVPVEGPVKLLDVQTPLYPDGWMGEALNFKVAARARISSATVSFWTPDESTITQEFTLAMGGGQARVSHRGGLGSVSLDLSCVPGDEFTLSLRTSQTQRADGDDERQISAIVSGISFD